MLYITVHTVYHDTQYTIAYHGLPRFTMIYYGIPNYIMIYFRKGYVLRISFLDSQHIQSPSVHHELVSCQQIAHNK